ncbi:MAG TPA: YkvA family protein [Candidatus Limnocylindrales bacterium]|nr:YkvA family protein [Candidatus Limnocylindrales bacterium]
MARKQGKGRGGGSGRALSRVLSMTAFLPVASRAPIYTRLIWALLRDERTPMSRKVLLGGALGYLVLPADLIPDRIPLIGGLDDLVVVVLAVDLFLDGVPSEVLVEKLDELGIERSAFDRDVAQIRRLMPAPVRRAIRRVPQAIGLGAGALRSTRIGPRVRAWITKEGSLA